MDKEELNARMREYMRVYNSKKCKCSCGRIVSKGKYPSHIKTAIHLRYSENPRPEFNII
jgi:hypothetical protein